MIKKLILKDRQVQNFVKDSVEYDLELSKLTKSKFEKKLYEYIYTLIDSKYNVNEINSYVNSIGINRADSINSLIMKLSEYLQEKNRIIVFEDANLRTSDHILKKISNFVIYKEKVYHVIDSNNTDCKILLNNKIKDSDSGYHFLCSGIPISIEEFVKDGFDIVNEVDFSVLGAFDGEGFIIIE